MRSMANWAFPLRANPGALLTTIPLCEAPRAPAFLAYMSGHMETSPSASARSMAGGRWDDSRAQLFCHSLLDRDRAWRQPWWRVSAHAASQVLSLAEPVFSTHDGTGETWRGLPPFFH